MAAIFLTVATLLLVLGVWVATTLMGPRSRAAEERQRIEREARLAQWRLQQVTSSALQRLLDEARRRM